MSLEKVVCYEVYIKDQHKVGAKVGIMEAQPSMKNEASREIKPSSLEGGYPLSMAYDFSFNQINNPLQDWKQETIFVTITFNGGDVMLMAVVHLAAWSQVL